MFLTILKTHLWNTNAHSFAVDQTPMTEFQPSPPALSELPVGTRVVRHPTLWQPNAFDAWGRGEGIGVVVEPPFPLDPGKVDVRWPAGRCFEWRAGLQTLDSVPSGGQNSP